MEGDLPEQYKFKEKFLSGYTHGMMFPHRIFIEGPGGLVQVLNKPDHPMADFMEFVKRASSTQQGDRSGNPEEHWLAQKASMEAIYLSTQEGAFVGTPPSEEEMERFGYYGAIERYHQFSEELRKTIDYGIAKGVPTGDSPLGSLITLREQVEGDLERFTKRDNIRVMVIHMKDISANFFY